MLTTEFEQIGHQHLKRIVDVVVIIVCQSIVEFEGRITPVDSAVLLSTSLRTGISLVSMVVACPSHDEQGGNESNHFLHKIVLNKHLT